ncbi:hypothetical protein ACYULU_16105 [Breznakiellaceae bacterium SP9]
MRNKSSSLSVLWSVLAFVLAIPAAEAAEYKNGDLRLVLNEATGRFSLYYLTDPSRGRYESFLTDQDPRTSFLAVQVNDRSYKLGDASIFRVRLSGTQANPALVFESAFLRVSEEFTFIKTPSFSTVNGVLITLRLENLSQQQASVGLRLLLDTYLGESGTPQHFLIDSKPVNTEIFLEKSRSTQRWVSRNDRLSLMGSIPSEAGGPDGLHFANWNRLSEAPWKTAYNAGHNFNFPPYSIGDSAVCYYFNPVTLGRGERVHFSLHLSTEDSKGFVPQNTAAAPNRSRTVEGSVPLPERIAPQQQNTSTRSDDIKLLTDLIKRIDGYMVTNSISDEELAAIESVINRLKAQYKK